MTSPSTLQAVYIQDKNSGLVFEYQPDTTYEVVIEKKTSSKCQQWGLADSGVAGYVYVQSMYDNKVITAGDAKQDPLIVSPKKTDLDLTQLWILREPNNGTNPHFVLMSAKTGLVMDVKGANKAAGTQVQIYTRSNNDNQQFAFIQWINVTEEKEL